MNETTPEPKIRGNHNPLTRQIKEMKERIEQLSKQPALPVPSCGGGNSILVVIPFHAGDITQAKDLLTWCTELSPSMDHPVLLVADSAIPVDQILELKSIAAISFSDVRAITVKCNKKGWPSACNEMFLWSSRFIGENYKLPFLWMEPDCVPIKSNWLTSIASEYSRSPMRYMGAIIEQTGQKNMPAKHLTGCSVYPNNAYDVFGKMKAVVDGLTPWDIAGGLEVVQGSQRTPLIQHFWGPSQDQAPVFVEAKAKDSPINHVMLDFISQEAVLFHRTKDSGLIGLLRKTRNGGSVPQADKANDNIPSQVQTV